MAGVNGGLNFILPRRVTRGVGVSRGRRIRCGLINEEVMLRPDSRANSLTRVFERRPSSCSASARLISGNKTINSRLCWRKVRGCRGRNQPFSN